MPRTLGKILLYSRICTVSRQYIVCSFRLVNNPIHNKVIILNKIIRINKGTYVCFGSTVIF
ncbi:hypothetical protein J2S17_005876 [Cytobacillus purgationiresistens]|uniref:Uncharacterized protein n=1 Tax=Cytobacillus purgationiresistens TaxID=863449 RepID=A0ABU0ASB6_9BACI|nr:hypothetical protein [Cytobacillus purgationiresistens]